MPRIDSKRMKEIEKKVDTYIKTGDIKDENGVVTGNIILKVVPETLLDFYVSGVLAGLNSTEARYAKHYLKDKLPFKEYIKTRGKDKELRTADIMHFHELLDGGKI